jgi:hypothetical protein
LSFDLTADTPSPVSARGIADDDNDRRGGDARNDSARPPDLPHLHETSVYTRSNTSHALASVTTPVTNSSSSPRRKKLRSSQRRYSGNDDVSAFGSPPVENRKSSFLLPKLTPRGSETLSPVVVDFLAGKNSSVTPSVSRFDSDTLLASRLDSVRFRILAGTNQFRGPREIPRFLNGVFIGQFLPQVQIPADHPRGEIIRWAAATLRKLPAYQTRSDYIEHQIWTLVTVCIQSHPPRRSCGEVSDNPIGCK